jgi:hypothetical protein
MKKFERVGTLTLLHPSRLRQREAVPCEGITTIEQLRFSFSIVDNVAKADVEKTDVSPSELAAINFAAGRSTPSRSGQQDYKRFLAAMRSEQPASRPLYVRDLARKSQICCSRGSLSVERGPRLTGLFFSFLLLYS